MICPASVCAVCLSTLATRHQTSRRRQTVRRARTDGRPGVYSGAMPASADQVRRSGAPDSLRPDPPEDCRPQVHVVPLPLLNSSQNCALARIV